MCIARDPAIRLRDMADMLSITERRAYGIVVDLTVAGYVAKERAGRRNRYEIRGDLPFPEALGANRSLGEVLEVLSGMAVGPQRDSIGPR
jgi:hypothetical protein